MAATKRGNLFKSVDSGLGNRYVHESQLGKCRSTQERHGGVKLRPGEQLKELRNRLGVTTREVEEYS